MLLVPTTLPAGSSTSQSPTQKSNWRYSGARQGETNGEAGGDGDCALAAPGPIATTRAKTTTRPAAGGIDTSASTLGGWRGRPLSKSCSRGPFRNVLARAPGLL